MAYFEPYIDGTGVHIPTYADCMEYLTSKYKEIFGADAYIKEGTKDYQLLSIFAKCWDDLSALVVQDYNSRDPNYAEGRSLDLLVQINSMTRLSATKSTVTLALTGTAGQTIAAGAKAIDKSGYIWTTTEACNLDSSGTGMAPASCDTAGAIDAPAGTITSIYVMQDGWQTVTNPADADKGRNVETDAELRNRRKLVEARMNNGGFDALARALIEIDGVEKSDVVVNNTGSTDANGIPAHSICALVLGGDSAEIAEAVFKAKAPGIGTYGSSSETYTDRNNHTNTVYFTRAAAQAVDMTVTINRLSGYDATRCQELIRSTLIDAISALGIGEAYGVTTAYRDIYNAFEGSTCPFVIASVTAGPHGDTQGSQSVPCDYDKYLTLDTANISIVEN